MTGNLLLEHFEINYPLMTGLVNEGNSSLGSLCH